MSKKGNERPQPGSKGGKIEKGMNESQLPKFQNPPPPPPKKDKK